MGALAWWSAIRLLSLQCQVCAAVLERNVRSSIPDNLRLFGPCEKTAFACLATDGKHYVQLQDAFTFVLEGNLHDQATPTMRVLLQCGFMFKDYSETRLLRTRLSTYTRLLYSLRRTRTSPIGTKPFGKNVLCLERTLFHFPCGYIITEFCCI